MSETDARRLDPRYDARFQRGYAGEARPDAAADASETVESPRAVPQPPEPMAAPADTAPEPAPPAPAPALAHAPEAAPVPVPVPSEASAPADPVSASEPVPNPSPAVVPGDGALARVEHDAPADSRRPDFWFLGAWVLAGAALVIGAALYWSGIMAQDFFGPTAESDRLLQLAGFTIGPALVQVGLLGLVGLLGWAGVRHARGSARATTVAGSVAESPVVTEPSPEGEGA